LSQALDELITQAQATSRRGETRLRAHLFSQLLCLGRHTITGLLCTAGRLFHDWSADYRLYAKERVDPAALFGVARREWAARVPGDRPLVLALDDSIQRKRGRKIPGSAWRRDPLSPPFAVNWAWSQRVLQISGVLPLNAEGLARALPLDYVQAPSALRPRKTAPPEVWEQYRQQQRVLNINVQARQRLEQLQQHLQREQPGRRPWIVTDGRFTNRTLLKNPPVGMTFIGRIRGDAKLFAPPSAGVGPRGGRPRTYGAPLPTPERLRSDDASPWQTVRAFAAGRMHEFRVKTLGPLRWRATGKTAQRLIVIAPLGYRLTRRGRLLYRQPAYLLCNDPDAPLEQVLQAYVWRWDIEVNFRDEKTLLGVGQAQVRNPHAVQNVPAVAVAAYSLLLLAAVKAYGPTGVSPALPAPAWRRGAPAPRPSTMRLIHALRHELWGQALSSAGLSNFPTQETKPQKSPKPHPTIATALFYNVAG
jgi:hypothetical protein